MPTTFYSNGKLLLTGEYTVLDGALSLAIPTKYGQSLTVDKNESNHISWKSLSYKDEIWFEHAINFEMISSGVSNSDDDVLNRLIQILNAAKQLNSNFLNISKGFTVTTQLDFPNDWGLGTSSTLINNIANWAQVDPYKLLDLTFGGSGYDIACAQHKSPLTYQLNNKSRLINPIVFNPEFKAHLFFVYLNRKQNSRDSISHYNANKKRLTESVSEINNITAQIIDCNTLVTFETMMVQHENIISKLIQQDPVKSVLFSDYDGAIKSLGGWGGDFILVTSKGNPTSYFKNKGYHTIIPYSDMILT